MASKKESRGRRDFRKQILRPLTDDMRKLILREIRAGHIPQEVVAKIMPHGRYSRRAAWLVLSKQLDQFVKGEGK